MKQDPQIDIKTETVDPNCKLKVESEPEDLGHLVLTTSYLGMVKSEPVDQDDHNHDPDKCKEIQSTEVTEKDTLDTSDPCCHICQAEATGKQFYGGVCSLAGDYC